MSSPLSFLRPLRYDRVRDVLLVQTDPDADLAGIVARLRQLFPGCSVQVLVREADVARGRDLAVENLEVARWEERFELLSRLRRRRFDAAVLQLGGRSGSNELRLLPYLVRARYLIAFNDRLDYFPLNVFRLTALAQHLSLAQGEVGAADAMLWMARRAVVSAVANVAGLFYLVASVGWLHARGWLRRQRRGDVHIAARAGSGVG